MQTLQADFLSTSPPRRHEEVRGPTELQETTASDKCSSRSQVRATLQTRLEDCFIQPSGVRVTTATPGVVEATSVAKHGEGRLLSFRDDPQQVRKRSLQRALKRAVNKGKTTYQGRPLRVWSASTPFPQQSPVKHPGPTRPGPERIQCIHWNCSGLSEELKAEWFAWLRQKPEVRIFVLVETHWSFSNSYISDEWHLTHSAKAAGKGGGIMIGVKKECVDLNSIKWREIIPGRLLHWRGSIGKQQVDIAAVYQTALGFVSGDQKSDLMKERHKLWAQLDNLMSSLPFRSSIIVAGDMNLTMAPMSEVAGHGILPGSSAAWLVQEREEVMLLLKKHRLVAINTWCRPNHTYHHPNGKSQIDYIMIRKQMADNLSRKCSTISSPIAAWRSSGHRPLQASIKLNWKPWQGTTTRPSAPAPLAANLEQIASEVRPSLSELQIAVKQQLDAPRALQQKMKPRNMDQEILAVWRQHKYQRKQLQTAQTIPIDAEALDKAAKDARSNLRKLTRSRKRQQLLDTLQAAETAFHEKQMRTHYALLRQLAPKSYRRKLCLRANTSALLSNAQECEWLKEYARELFNDEPFSMPPLLPVDQAWFEESQWVQALERLKAHKAVPHGSAEIASWKQHAKVLAKPLSAIAMNALTVASPTVPTEWSMVQMAWIPKPGKAPTEPGNLRTIGLMGADSKAFLMILKDQAAPWIQQALQNTPQYAYRSMASTCDALLRGSKHCMNVRTALAGVLEDHTSKILHTGRVPLLGGIMVSLDLSKAFDKLQYSEMYESMRETGMPEELSRLIMHVHANTALHIVHGGHRSTTGMRRGLRQGCGVAPIVYACWTIRLCRLINQALRHGWAQEHSSIYADDKHFYWEISSESTMDEAIEQLKTIITIIRTLGMQINFQKSVAVIALKGYMVKRVLQKHTQWRYGIKHLRIRMDTNDIYIPVEAQMQYLGAVLSYTAFEQHTADLRIRQANQNFAQLRKVLRTSGGLSKARRLSIYRMCVWTALLYGITSVGVTASVCRTLQSTAAMHLRKILRIHTKGHSNEAVLQQAQLELLPHLQRGAQQQAHSISADVQRSTALRWQEAERIQQIHEQLEIIQSQGLSQTMVQIPEAEVRQIACTICGQIFPTAAGLHQHVHQRHPEIEQAASIDFRRDKHSLFGLPHCRFCHHRLGSWQMLTKHITQGMCLRIKLALGKGQSIAKLLDEIEVEEQHYPPERPAGDEGDIHSVMIPETLKQLIQATPLRELHLHSQVWRSHASQCWLCGQRLVQASRIKTHWQSSHQDVWHRCRLHATTEAASLSSLFSRPCAFCKSNARDAKLHARQCPVMFQILSLRWLHAQASLTELDPGHKPKAHKQKAAPPAYKSFASPLTTAFAKGSSGRQTPQALNPSATMAAQADVHSLQHAALPPIRKVKDFLKVRTGSIKDYMLQTHAPAASSTSSTQATLSCRIQLRNPHNLCYANASILMLLHCVELIALKVPTMNFLIKLGTLATSRGREMLLAQMHQFRQLSPQWEFNNEQKDASEYLHTLFHHTDDLQVVWDSRVIHAGIPRIALQGTHPVAMPLPLQDNRRIPLLEVVEQWHIQQESAAFVHAYPVICIQLNRYIANRKDNRIVEIPDRVRLPFHTNENQVEWREYWIGGAILHLGSTPHRGHYRALLRVGASWCLTDDGKPAEPITLHDGHRRNVYMIMMHLNPPMCSHAHVAGSPHQ